MKRSKSNKETQSILEMDTLVINHQNGELLYRLEKGGYYRSKDVITISVETESDDVEQFPDCALFCLEGFQVTGALKAGDVFECKGGMDFNSEDKLPKAHAYFGIHAAKVLLRWMVKDVKRGTVIFEMSAIHDDVDYYDARAKPTPTRGLFTLSEKPSSELWIPQ